MIYKKTPLGSNQQQPIVPNTPVTKDHVLFKLDKYQLQGNKSIQRQIIREIHRTTFYC